MSMISRAWMLDPIEFHLDLERLRRSPDGDVAVREQALRTWASTDPIVRSYLEVLPVSHPDEWLNGTDASYLADWYRVLMAPYLIPTRAFHAPDLLRRRLPDLGWPPCEARRLARGRELIQLTERHGTEGLAAVLSPHLRLGNKGWLAHEDLLTGLDRMRRLDRGAFRHHQDLVPVVENAFEVLEAAATKPDHVMLSITD